MAKEYKTLTFEDTERGRQEMQRSINWLAKEAWIVTSKETVQQGWALGKTCCLGCLFLPLALLGKKKGMVQVLLERDTKEKAGDK